jgi:hypothetical protein
LFIVIGLPSLEIFFNALGALQGAFYSILHLSVSRLDRPDSVGNTGMVFNVAAIPHSNRTTRVKRKIQGGGRA